MENQTVVRQEAPLVISSSRLGSADRYQELAERINAGEKDIVLLGATGTGNRNGSVADREDPASDAGDGSKDAWRSLPPTRHCRRITRLSISCPTTTTTSRKRTCRTDTYIEKDFN